MELTGKIADLSLDFITGKAKLTFEINEKQDAMNCYDELHEVEKLSIKVTKHKQKRSLNANAYAWVLIGKLADKLSIPKNEVYKEHIKSVGVFRQVEIDEKAVDTLIHSWQLHGIGWVAEKIDYSVHEGFVIVHLYYGSSTYNKQQMARLIDNIVQDCKEQGIETMTPEELNRLKDLWGGE